MNKKHPSLRWITTGTIVVLGFTALAWWASIDDQHLQNAVNFFAQFGSAMISAGIAAWFVIYQAHQARADAESTQDEDNRIEQALAYNRVRPMLYLIAKEYRPEKRMPKIEPGDHLFFSSAGLDAELPETFIDHVNNAHDASLTLLELRFFYGEPIHHVRIYLPSATRMNSKLYIPYLETNQRNVIVTGDMFKTLPTYRQQIATEAPLVKGFGPDDYAPGVDYKPFDTDLPHTDVVRQLFKGGVIIEFDTVLHEHVCVTFAYDGKSFAEGEITLAYNNQTTRDFMHRLITTNKVPTEANVTVPAYTHREAFPMQKSSYTTIYTAPANS